MSTPTDRIQIKPGVWIEVSKRLKKASGLGSGVRIRNRLEDEERKRVLGDSIQHRKYSRLLLAEASSLADKVGIVAAAKATGVKYWSIMGYRRELRLQGKLRRHKNPRKGRYTLEQKQKCVLLAFAIADKQQRGLSPAFIESGRRLGVNGYSILHQWRNRHFQLPSSTLAPPQA